MIYSIFQSVIAAAGITFVALLVSWLTIAGLSLQQIADSPLTPAIIVSVLSATLAAILELVPGLSDKWFKLPKEAKRLSWLAGCAAIGIVPWLLGCIGKGLSLDPDFLWIARTCEADTLAQGLAIAAAAYFAGHATLAATIVTRKALNIAPYDEDAPPSENV